MLFPGGDPPRSARALGIFLDGSAPAVFLVRMVTASKPTDPLTASASRLRAYLLILQGDAASAEDAFQELCLRWLENGPEVESPRAAEGWLFTTARNLALNRRRGERRRAANEEIHARRTKRDPSVPEEEYRRADDHRRLTECLGRLGRKLREIVYLKVAEERSLAEIAALVEMPRSTVAVRVQEALVLLHRCLGGRGS